MSESFSMPGDTTAVSDFRTWTDEQLVTSAKDGQTASYGELCQRHIKQLFCVAHRITRNREDTEDAVQDCLLNAFVHLRDFDARSRFASWLTRITINAAFVQLRKRRGNREVPLDAPASPFDPGVRPEIQDDAPGPEETCYRRERKRIVNTAVSELRPRVRKAVQLRHLQERSLRETAQLLGISTAAAKSRMFHARAALHRMPLLRDVGQFNLASAGE